MPIEHRIDPERRLVRTRAWGRITDEELFEATRDLADDPRFEPDFRQLADFTGVTQIDVSSNTVRDLAWSSPFGAGATRAAVAGSDLAFGMLRMYDGHAKGRGRLRIFRSLSEAEAWIGWKLDED